VRIKAGPQRKVLREQHRPTGDKKLFSILI
jgi:hypothetical protein